MAARHRLGVVAHELGGSPSGPMLLVLHANGFHGRVFLPMLPVFAPHFRCVALDLPGHGSAPTPSEPFTAEELLGAVRDYVNAQGIQDCYCLGHSLGGAMAALLQLERPQTFRAMFLFEPVVRPFEQLEGGAAAPRSAAAEPAAATAAASGRVEAPRDVSGGSGSGGGCGPSPSLAAGPGSRPDSLLARIARKRQAVYPSVEAAKATLGAKPPFNTFDPQALHAYLACGGLRPLQPSDSDGDGAPTSVSSASAAVTLSCAPENEARVYEALEPPPWRPWQQLTTGSGAGQDGCRGGGDAGCCGGDGGGCGACAGSVEPGRDCGGCGGGGGCDGGREDRPVGQRRPPCRVAIAVGREVGLHAVLARWGAEVAQLVPGAELIRFPSLQHLAPMEDPRAVAGAALKFFFACDNGVGPGAGLGSGLGSGAVTGSGGAQRRLDGLSKM
ncbi:hypothetical protein PLESTB_000153500 [Pleodorina starrii]|uniref:AB hydrolase-1 domain-containing protein n=1 Tax=Pleodorina starrii TaxID=330485 RepID=A0A9W6BBR3_9CHLO|nr:hypothetical protein PLESTM_000452200 [Pleodorina starrii]GLC48833.1 hypothetical protein PLESTB_000153500 [Pleodorina starrii]